MQATVFCRTTDKDVQSFYLRANGKEYFLFSQAFRRSNKNFFAKGYRLADKVDYSKVTSTTVRNTLEKLPSYIRYIETEYGIALYEKRKEKEKPSKTKSPYKREQWNWRLSDWDVA